MIYTNRRRNSQLVISLLTAWCTLIALSALASGQTLIDDFSDGDDVGWFRTTIDGSEGISDAGEWEVVDGRYHISSNRPVPGGFTISSFWRRPNQSPLGNGTVRFQVTAETEAIGAGIILAKDVVFDGSEDYGEFYEFAMRPRDNFFYVVRCQGTTVTGEGFGCSQQRRFITAIDVGESWWMEASNIDGQKTLKVWQDGQLEPGQPQISFTDNRSFTPDVLGIGGYVVGSTPTRFGASFDDISFSVVPEPSGVTLLLTSLGCLIGLGRTHHKRHLAVS